MVDCFVTGRGTVVSGKLERGTIKQGEKCVIMGKDLHYDAQVGGVEMFRQVLEKAEAGDNCGVLIKGIKRDQIKRGQVLGKPGTINMHNNIEAQVCSCT